MTKEQIKWINVAKGIGIILVVYGHVIIGIHNSSLDFSGPVFDIQESVIYSFHMPLFFFLSGVFVKKWAERDFKVAMSSKLKTLIYPYFLWSLLQGFIMYGLGKVTNGDVSISEILKIPIEPIAQFWFLYVLFFCFLLYYGLSQFLDNKTIFLLSIVLFMFTPLLKFWVLARIAFHFFFFVMGTTNIKSFKNDSLYYLILFVVSNIFIYSNFAPVYFIYIFKLLAGISGILLTVKACKKLDRNNLLLRLGLVSMPIYLMHIIAGSGIRVILLKLGVNSIFVHVLLGTVIGIIAPVIADQIIKKLKLTKVLYGK